MKYNVKKIYAQILFNKYFSRIRDGFVDNSQKIFAVKM